MTPAAEALGRRWMALSGFEWPPGMEAATRSGLTRITDTRLFTENYCTPHGHGFRAPVPNVEDAATIGVLAAWARERLGMPRAIVVRWVDDDFAVFEDCASYRFWSDGVRGYGPLLSTDDPVGSEAEAWIVAVELCGRRS